MKQINVFTQKERLENVFTVSQSSEAEHLNLA
jgi:hypothetical protein